MPEEPKEVVEAELLRRIGLGDQQAFAEFYDRSSAVLFSMSLRILKDPKEAEEILQEAFLQIWERASTFDPNLGKPLTWAITLVRNKAIDRLRALQRRYRLSEKVLEESLAGTDLSEKVSENLQSSESAALIRSALAILPPDQRQAIELAFFGGLTQNDISEKLQQPLGTVKARIRRGLLKLRECLEKAL